VQIGELRLEPSDSIAADWRYGAHRRCVIGLNSEDARLTFKRILGRFTHGTGFYADASRHLDRLAVAGRTVAVTTGGHTVGLVRPFILAGDELVTAAPVMIGVGPDRDLTLPMVIRDVKRARSAAREINAAVGHANEWRAFEGERLAGPVEQFLPRVSPAGRHVARTDLEERLAAVLGPRRTHRRREAA